MIVAGCDVNRLQRKIAAGRFLPQGSLLAAIKEDGSERSLLAALCSERCVLRLKGDWVAERLVDRRLRFLDAVCDCFGCDLGLRFCEVLAANWCGFRVVVAVDEEDSSGLMDLQLGERRWMKATSKAIVEIAWKMEAAEMATGQQERGSNTR
ncbi:hypothetical protein BHE74_00005628 [Ensete ventricosum]|nr:hypothetical protein BHE74_00005628 [Ensete ventricosum]